MSFHLLTGGARSGKSRGALSLAEAVPSAIDFVATAEAGDADMAARIAAAHRGKITFKSEWGNGSLFALWVPTRQPESYQMQDAWRPERMLASMV